MMGKKIRLFHINFIMTSEEGAWAAVNDFGGNVANMQLPKCTKNLNAEREAVKSINVFLLCFNHST